MKEIFKTMWNNGKEKDREDMVLMYLSGADRDMSFEVFKGHIDYLMDNKIRSTITLSDLVNGPIDKPLIECTSVRERFDKVKENFARVLYTAPDFILASLTNEFNRRGENSPFYKWSQTMSISDNKIERDKSHIEMSAMVINFNDFLSLACLYGVNKLEFYKLSNDISEIYVRNLLDMGVFLENSPEVKFMFNCLNKYFAEEKYYTHIKEVRVIGTLNYEAEHLSHRISIRKELIKDLKANFLANDTTGRYKSEIDNDSFFKNVKKFVDVAAIIAARLCVIKKFSEYEIDGRAIDEVYPAPLFKGNKSYEANLRCALDELRKFNIKDGYVKVEKKFDDKHYNLLNYAFASIGHKEFTDMSDEEVNYGVMRNLFAFRKTLVELRGSLSKEMDFLNNPTYMEVAKQEIDKLLHIVRIFPKMFYFALNDGFTTERAIAGLLYKYIHNYVVEQEDPKVKHIFTGRDLKLMEDLMKLEGALEEDELLKLAVANINDLFEEMPPIQFVHLDMYKVFYDRYFEYKEGILYATNKHFNESIFHNEAILRLTIMDLAAQVMAFHNTIVIHEDITKEDFNVDNLEGLYLSNIECSTFIDLRNKEFVPYNSSYPHVPSPYPDGGRRLITPADRKPSFLNGCFDISTLAKGLKK